MSISKDISCQKLKLSQVFDLQMGKTPSRNNPQYWNGCNKWLAISDLDGGKIITKTREAITDLAIQDTNIKKVPKGTVVMSFKLSIGKTAITGEDMYTNEAIMAFHIKDNYEVDTHYLYHWCKSNNWLDTTNKAVMGLTLNKATMMDKEIKLPAISIQKEIAIKLNKIDNAIALGRSQLENLNLLVKSRFIEMFGDLVHNSNGLEENCLCELADIVSGITKGRKTKETEFVEVPYMAVSNVKDGYIDWTTVKTILATKSEIEQYRLQPNDILMTEGGDPDKLGRGSIIKTPLENCIHQNHIFRVRLNQKVVSPVYFSYFLKNPKAKRYFLNCAKQTTGIASINMTQLKSLPVIVPPLSLQNQFADFVAQVDKSKLAVQQSLNELETLKKSLMQQYFG